MGKEAKENVWARVAKMGTCAVGACRLSDGCVDQCRARIKRLVGKMKSPLHLLTTHYIIFCLFLFDLLIL